jgi:hypothetical protein
MILFTNNPDIVAKLSGGAKKNPHFRFKANLA